jgi:hypothetical protein
MVRATFRMRSWRAGAEALLGHGAFEQAFAVGGEFAVVADGGGHLGVAVEFFAGTGEGNY